MILIDTSVWIDYFNGYPSFEKEQLMLFISTNQAIVLPGLVLTEILLGLKTDAEAARISNLLDAFIVAPECDQQDHKEAARIYRLCRQKGFTIRSTIDCLIAQLCLRHNYILLSKDKDFQVIAKCTPLQLLDRHH
ncbi:PIN domain nuclease [soil metagenome]